MLALRERGMQESEEEGQESGAASMMIVSTPRTIVKAKEKEARDGERGSFSGKRHLRWFWQVATLRLTKTNRHLGSWGKWWPTWKLHLVQ